MRHIIRKLCIAVLIIKICIILYVYVFFYFLCEEEANGHHSKTFPSVVLLVVIDHDHQNRSSSLRHMNTFMFFFVN